MALIKEATKNIPNVEVSCFSGLLVDFCKEHGAKVAIKGLRALTDFEYEFQMALMNKRLAEEVETMFLMTRAEHSFISSSTVKDLVLFNASPIGLVPECVVEPLNKKIAEKRKASNGQ